VSLVAEQITCRELVELVTDYLDGALPEAERRRFEAHIGACENCNAYLEQIRLVIKASGRLDEDDLSPAAREGLLEAFRGWKRGDG
jgi:anti-sigma factor RsiW